MERSGGKRNQHGLIAAGRRLSESVQHSQVEGNKSDQILLIFKLAGEGKSLQAKGKNIAARGKAVRRLRETFSQVKGLRIAG